MQTPPPFFSTPAAPFFTSFSLFSHFFSSWFPSSFSSHLFFAVLFPLFIHSLASLFSPLSPLQPPAPLFPQTVTSSSLGYSRTAHPSSSLAAREMAPSHQPPFSFFLFFCQASIGPSKAHLKSSTANPGVTRGCLRARHLAKN